MFRQSWILFFSVVVVFPQTVEVWTVDQGVIQGVLDSIDQKNLILRTVGVKREVSNEDIILVKWPGRLQEKRSSLVFVEFVNGDVLRGTIEGGDENVLQLKLSSTEKAEIQIDFLRRVVFPGRARSENLAPFVTSEGRDRIYRRSGTSLDFINGTFEGFEGSEIAFHSVLGPRKWALSEIVALVLTPMETLEEGKELLAIFHFTDGSRLTCKPLGIQGNRIELEGLPFGKLRIPLKDILTIRFKNGRYVYLSDLDPIRVEESSPFRGSDSVSFPFRKDRSVGDNPLRVGGVEFFRGLGVHSYSRLVFAVEKKYRIFRTSIGIDDEVLDFPAKGSVVFRVWVDGKMAYESPLVRGGEAPIQVPDIELQGVAELALEVDYAEDLHIADRADWLDPLLIR